MVRPIEGPLCLEALLIPLTGAVEDTRQGLCGPLGVRTDTGGCPLVDMIPAALLLPPAFPAPTSPVVVPATSSHGSREISGYTHTPIHTHSL